MEYILIHTHIIKYKLIYINYLFYNKFIIESLSIYNKSFNI